jgi:hypothetical protein
MSDQLYTSNNLSANYSLAGGGAAVTPIGDLGVAAKTGSLNSITITSVGDSSGVSVQVNINGAPAGDPIALTAGAGAVTTAALGISVAAGDIISVTGAVVTGGYASALLS